jgi:molybdopterin synthase sulfur carrier subunit
LTFVRIFAVCLERIFKLPVIKLFANLRQLAGAAQLDVAGTTVYELIQGLCAQKPQLQGKILDGARLFPHVRVMVNGHDVELEQGLDTPVGPQDQVTIFPPIAGG